MNDTKQSAVLHITSNHDNHHPATFAEQHDEIVSTSNHEPYTQSASSAMSAPHPCTAAAVGYGALLPIVKQRRQLRRVPL